MDVRLSISWGICLCGFSILWLPKGWASEDAKKPASPVADENGPPISDPFIQIPGPNPILEPGPEGTWDDEIIESADAFKDFGTYYLYYHGAGGDGYRLGVATAKHPLGPFKKHGDGPILAEGPKGGWDSKHVASAMVLKEGPKDYVMFYSGYGEEEPHRIWRIGLARAEHPLGPWVKYECNPIIENFGYVGGAVKVDGTYYLYTAYPIDSIAPDYSPMALATAPKPEGPWTPHVANPVLKPGQRGEWDDGGFSEAEVFYAGGVFHMLYGGAKIYAPRILTRESIGYAWSRDGVHFTKHALNPVATREAEPNAAAFAEVHSIFEPPYIYVYHTLRYKEAWRDRFRSQFPSVEDLGVQVLVMQTSFSLAMPVLDRETLAPGASTALDDSPSISLTHVRRVAITSEYRHGSAGEGSLRVLVYPSYDGLHYDTKPSFVFEDEAPAGQLARATHDLQTSARFIKVRVENLDREHAVTDVKIIATLGS